MNNTTPPQDPGATAPVTHIYVLLDRSGSMEAIRDDVIGGLNAFVAEQRADGDDARVTLVQFDSQDPDEVVVEDVPIAEAPLLTRETFAPRGATPLLDATGLLVARAQERATERKLAGITEAVTIVTVTDGHENASVEFTRDDVRALVEKREQEGWVFVFLSAGLDAYDEAHGFGYAPGAVQSWAGDAGGADLAFTSLSSSMKDLRRKRRRNLAAPSSQFFESGKPAEQDRSRKRGDRR